jgi:hypothetical protein
MATGDSLVVIDLDPHCSQQKIRSGTNQGQAIPWLPSEKPIIASLLCCLLLLLLLKDYLAS